MKSLTLTQSLPHLSIRWCSWSLTHYEGQPVPNQGCKEFRTDGTVILFSLNQVVLRLLKGTHSFPPRHITTANLLQSHCQWLSPSIHSSRYFSYHHHASDQSNDNRLDTVLPRPDPQFRRVWYFLFTRITRYVASTIGADTSWENDHVRWWYVVEAFPR